MPRPNVLVGLRALQVLDGLLLAGDLVILGAARGGALASGRGPLREATSGGFAPPRRWWAHLFCR